MTNTISVDFIFFIHSIVYFNKANHLGNLILSTPFASSYDVYNGETNGKGRMNTILRSAEYCHTIQQNIQDA